MLSIPLEGKVSTVGALSLMSLRSTLISCVAEYVPSVTVTVSTYTAFVSLSGADEKVKTPEFALIFTLISLPPSEIENTKASPSASVAVTVPMAVWFSSAVKEALM